MDRRGRRLTPIRLRRAERPQMRGLEALIVGLPRESPEKLWADGMRGMGDDSGGGWLNTLTGGAVGNISAQLAKVEFALKVSTAAAVGSAILSLWLAYRRRD